MRTSVRVVLLGGWTALGLGLCLLGFTWHRDRHRDWQEPRWEPHHFERLAGASDDMRPWTPVSATGRVRRVMAVNLRCAHCMELLRTLMSHRDPPAGLGVLIVDTPARPSVGDVDALPVTQVWWDRDGVWRHAWGHRRYGEILEFDGNGRYLGAIDPEKSIVHHGPPDTTGGDTP